VVDDGSTDRTRAIAAGFPVKVIDAEPLPQGWSGKCNACWSGAKAATGMWLLFTDADTVHQRDSIAQGLVEAERTNAAMLSYSPKQEVHSLAERALMPVIFAELARTFRPKDVSDPNSPAAAANGQYLLIRREVYDAVGGHAAVAKEILEDVELARRVKQARYRLQFRVSDVVTARMYRSFGAMWEGWTKNLALLFAHPVRLAAKRKLEWVSITVLVVASGWAMASGRQVLAWASGAAAVILYASFLRRILRAHFDCFSNACAFWGLPLFALLLLNSYISHKSGKISWKGRVYAGGR
jgi:glycosyltransferase involved in cell wall biosynthesis